MAPGSILQFMYLRSRLRQWCLSGHTFYEMGSGDGRLSEFFLSEGFTGIGFDLNMEANAFNRQLNAEAVRAGRYSVIDGSFIESERLEPVDVIASMMVIEHLEAPLVDAYFRKARSLLRPGGRILTLVPADMRAWGIEDEVAGHVKRHTRNCFHELAKTHQMTLVNLVGLTWPLSNLLLPISNRLVKRAEAALLTRTLHERTVASGHRTVQFKTTFPWWARILLNPVTLLPWYALQLLGQNSERCMILYCEMIPNQQTT